MSTQYKNPAALKKILWVDTLAGGITALAGLFWYPWLSVFLGIPPGIILIIIVVTLLYALVALTLSLQRQPLYWLLRILIYANWIWTVISIGLLIQYMAYATIVGITFLVLQVVIVGLLAWLEARFAGIKK